MNKINSINGILITAQNDFTEHEENMSAHITAEERSAWNAKADTEILETHLSDHHAHVSESEKDKWNNGIITPSPYGYPHLTDTGLTLGCRGYGLTLEANIDGGRIHASSTMDGNYTMDLKKTALHPDDETCHLTPAERTAWNAKANLSDLDSKTNTSTFNEHKSDTAAHITEEEREIWNGKQDKLTDASGNMTLEGSLTAGSSISANGGVNIPLGVPPVTNTSAVNRLVAEGMAVVRQAFTGRSLLWSTQVYGSATASALQDKQILRLYNNGQDNGTVKVHIETAFIGGSNYGTCTGYIIPFTPSYENDCKLTFCIGISGDYVVRTAQPIDTLTVSHKSTNTYFARFVDVTFYGTYDGDLKGYPVRVRETMYDRGNAKWVTYTTMSFVPGFNTSPSCVSSIVYQQSQLNRIDDCSLWLTLSGGYDGRHVIKIADLHGVTDSYAWSGLAWCYWDSSPIGNQFSTIGEMKPTLLSDTSQYNGAYYAFQSLETDLTQGPATATDFIPYE